MSSVTVEQAIKSVELCQSLSDLHQDIVLFRFDDLKGEIYILAGQDLEIVIYDSGLWEFLPNEPNFKTMNKTQLRAYVLEHREDREALRALMSRRDPNAVKYDFPNTEEGREQTKEVIKRKIEGNL